MATIDGRPQRPRNPRGQGQVLRQQLVDAAARLLATLDQPESLTLRQVAREVGVAPASIYSHFADLEALFNHVLELRYRELTALMRAADDAPTPLAGLVWRCATYVRWGIDNPGEYRTLFGGRVPPGVAATSHHVGIELLETLTTALSAVLGDGQDERGRQQGGILLWTAMHGLVSAFSDHTDMTWPPIDDLIVSMIALHTTRPPLDIVVALAQRATHEQPVP